MSWVDDSGFKGYDVAQVCMNGHTINDSLNNMPQFKQEYCDKCGAKTITACPVCNTPIRGRYWSDDVINFGGYSAPSYCYKCGKPFPWTEAKKQAALDLIKEESLPEEDMETFRKSLDDIVSDTPQTQIGAIRFKKILSKVGKETASAIREIVIDIVSEAAKKAIWG